MIFGTPQQAFIALVRRDVAGEAAVAAGPDVGMTGAATGLQIGSECLIMPDTCPDQPTGRRLACSGRGRSVL